MGTDKASEAGQEPGQAELPKFQSTLECQGSPRSPSKGQLQSLIQHRAQQQQKTGTSNPGMAQTGNALRGHNPSPDPVLLSQIQSHQQPQTFLTLRSDRFPIKTISRAALFPFPYFPGIPRQALSWKDPIRHRSSPDEQRRPRHEGN